MGRQNLGSHTRIAVWNLSGYVTGVKLAPITAGNILNHIRPITKHALIVDKGNLWYVLMCEYSEQRQNTCRNESDLLDRELAKWCNHLHTENPVGELSSNKKVGRAPRFNKYVIHTRLWQPKNSNRSFYLSYYFLFKKQFPLC